MLSFKKITMLLSAMTIGLLPINVLAEAPDTSNGEWPFYTGDIKGSRYSPLDQIDADNFEDLELAWSFSTKNLGSRAEYKLEVTPLTPSKLQPVMWHLNFSKNMVPLSFPKSKTDGDQECIKYIWKYAYKIRFFLPC